MADNNTLSFLEQCQEIAEKHGGKLSTALATLMLACQLNVANAQTAPVNPAVSANASSAKSPEH